MNTVGKQGLVVPSHASPLVPRAHTYEYTGLVHAASITPDTPSFFKAPSQYCVPHVLAHSLRLRSICLATPPFLLRRPLARQLITRVPLPPLPLLPPLAARRPIPRAYPSLRPARFAPLASPRSLTDRHRCFCWGQRRARRYRRPCAVTPLSRAVPTCGGTSAWTSRTPRSMRTRHSP